MQERIEQLEAMVETCAKAMNRRVTVENILWDCFHGHRAPPSPEECKELALKLGVPDADRIKNG